MSCCCGLSLSMQRAEKAVQACVPVMCQWSLIAVWKSWIACRLPVPRPGQVLGLVGTNGIGKSTALKVLAGKLKPNLGRFDVSCLACTQPVLKPQLPAGAGLWDAYSLLRCAVRSAF